MREIAVGFCIATLWQYYDLILHNPEVYACEFKRFYNSSYTFCAGNGAAEFIVGCISFVTYFNIIPALQHAHDSTDIGILQREIAVLPGQRPIHIFHINYRYCIAGRGRGL